MTQANMAVEPADEWSALTPAERESFLEAIARHRRMAWRVTAIGTIAISITGLVVGALTAPLFYAVLALTFDVINLVVPTPNLIGSIMTTVDDMQRSSTPTPASAWVHFAFMAALPGLAWTAVLLISLHRALRHAMALDVGELSARPPNGRVLAEQRIANVIGEMAVAAAMPAPRILISERKTLNAAVFGTDDAHATIVITQILLARLTRAEMQGIAAHLVGSIANGDMAIGFRSSLAICFFGAISRLAMILTDARGNAGRSLLALLRPILFPTRTGARQLIENLNDPFASTESRTEKISGSGNPARAALMDKIRDGLKIVLMGPVVLTGFLGGIASGFLLGSILSFAWRQRKYLADATAVRLTRDPDTLGHALEKLSSAGGGGTLEPWADHMAVSHGARGHTRFGAMVPMFPSLDRRLAALQKLGATLKRAPQRMSLSHKMLFAAFFTVISGLVALTLPMFVYLSIALSCLFLGLPVGILHVLLRWLGH